VRPPFLFFLIILLVTSRLGKGKPLTFFTVYALGGCVGAKWCSSWFYLAMILKKIPRKMLFFFFLNSRNTLFLGCTCISQPEGTSTYFKNWTVLIFPFFFLVIRRVWEFSSSAVALASLYLRDFQIIINKEQAAFYSSMLNFATHEINSDWQRSSLKVPKCEILMSWILMIFLSWSLYR
jgi:hypothetical protein